ncbi:hypothetical protein ISN44_As13g011240 [Arabidopsis suecica]|uniref:DUF4283 domain-containing protein n=1 Tax=Arabidopsis suecica TaxID=45249 RepID=A0A8T1Y1V6_ARASU|nr:hypothetical protein ISN44_As13g011240 [Arabidopsis suecica]
MSSAMDKALMAMSLEEEEEILFDMPNLPEFMSMERNVLSLVGCTLNPSCQSMKNLIRDMPRKWQKPGRMRGFAISSERFQFIFFNEHDLQEVLDKGSHTYNDWSLAVDRWYEVPPPNYLQIIPFWVQIWNMPINFYTVPTITTLGELIGEVKVVAFDPNRPHYLEFVCVKVLFDVSRPLHRSKVVNLPQGGTTTVRFQYERVQKRCYECQRITHEKNYCPILIKRREDLVAARRSGNLIPKPPKAIFLKKSDPLYGILREDQYMVVNNNEDWKIKAYRVRKSVSEVEKDPITKKMVMQLESPPVVQLQANKGKGVIFDYIDSDPGSMPKATVSSSQLLHPSALTSSVERNWLMDSESLKASEDPGSFLALSQPIQGNATVYRTGLKKAKPRKRPQKSVRKRKPKGSISLVVAPALQVGLSTGVKEKRKAEDEGTSTAKSTKLNPSMVNRARKRIEKLRNSNGVFQRSEAAKGEVATDYFMKLFKSYNPQSFQEWFSGFSPFVTAEMTESLIEKVIVEEVRQAIFSIKASSASGLTHLLNKGQCECKIQGIKYNEEGPEVHHLLFADDSLFMCKASLDQCFFLQQTLKRYGAASGQSINLSMSSITFGSRVDLTLKTSIQSSTEIANKGGAGSYLGMPECFSGSKVELLGYLKDRVKAKLSGWYSRFLSQGEKEVLLKSVALAMPVFVMSCFKLPKTTSDNLSSVMAAFWWSNAEHHNKIHWLSKCFSTIESAQKVREHWLEWMEAQKIEAEEESGLGNGLSGLGGSERSMAVGWIAPPINWLKCNVATSWSKNNKFDGCAWVLRDHVGKVLLHSRCALTGSLVKQEAQFKGLLWGMESMWFHRVEKVVFALQEEFLVNAVSRPAAWSSFRYQSMVLVQVLSSFRSWKILLENSSSNRGTFLIAKSVTDDCRLQSYVVVCHPAWLDGVFNEERISSSD